MTPEEIQKVREGARVRVLRFGEEDAYFENHTHGDIYKLLGRTGQFLAMSVGHHQGPDFFTGSFLFDDGEPSFFFQAKVELVP